MTPADSWRYLEEEEEEAGNFTNYLLKLHVDIIIFLKHIALVTDCIKTNNHIQIHETAHRRILRKNMTLCMKMVTNSLEQQALYVTRKEKIINNNSWHNHPLTSTGL